MTCMAVKGCERKVLEPFVEHLNSLEQTTYRHRDCLYFAGRQNPQPEELFVDEVTGGKLVIERKSIAWPDHYEHGHSKDHLVADSILNDLRDVHFTDTYALSLPHLIQGSKRDLARFSRGIATIIRKHLAKGATEVVGSDAPGRSWRFYKPAAWEIPDDAPEEGVVVLWSADIEDIYINPIRLPDGLNHRISRIFESCTKKFHDWPDARRVLVLDQFGALRYNDDAWWQRVFSSHKPPPSINEIWLGIFDWLDDWTRGWIFERLWKEGFETTENDKAH